MYKYNIYIGMFDKDTKKQELSTQDFLNTVRKIMSIKDIDNYTIYKCKGHYKYIDNTATYEPTLNIEIIEHENWTNFMYIGDLKNMLCNSLNQESVLITKQKIEVL